MPGHTCHRRWESAADRGQLVSGTPVIPDAAIGQLYLVADANGAAHADLSAVFTPEMFGSTATASLIRVIAAPEGSSRHEPILRVWEGTQTTQASRVGSCPPTCHKH